MLTSRDRRGVLSALLFHAAVTLYMAAPLIDYGGLAAASYVGDARLIIWTLAWDAHALMNGLPLFDANIFHPAAHALRFAEHHLGVALLALPVYAVSGNAILAYWVVWLAAFLANALAMHALGWRLTRSHVAAAVGGLVYAFSFFRMLHGHGHLQLLWTAWLPLSALALERWYADPTWRRLACLWALVLAQALVSWYLAVMVLVAQAVLLLVLVVAAARPRPVWRPFVQVAIGGAAGALVLWPLARPYLALGGAPLAEAADLSADAAAYLLPPENTALGQWVTAHTSLHPRWIWGEQTMYLGWIALALAGLGIIALVRGRGPAEAGPSDRPHARANAWGPASAGPDRALVAGLCAVGLVGLLLSFGPSASRLAPFDWLRDVPGLALFRAPARFGLLVLLGVATLAALGAAVLARRPRGRLALAFCVPLMLVEWRVVDFPNGKPERLQVPLAYRQLARLPPGAIVSLPDYRGADEWFREADYLLFSTLHWRPIANGYGRSEPPEFGPLMDDLRTFPSPRATAALRRASIRYVVCDADRYGRGAAELLARAVQEPGLRSLGTVGAVTIFEVPR